MFCLGVHIDIFLKFSGCYVTLTNDFIDMLFEDIIYMECTCRGGIGVWTRNSNKTHSLYSIAAFITVIILCEWCNTVKDVAFNQVHTVYIVCSSMYNVNVHLTYCTSRSHADHMGTTPGLGNMIYVVQLATSYCRNSSILLSYNQNISLQKWQGNL